MPTCEELLGDDFNVFWDQDDDWSSPNWLRGISVSDITINPNRKQIEIKKRIATATYKNGRGDWEFGFTMNYSRSNAFHRAIVAAISAPGDTPIHLAFVDGDDIDDPEASIWEAWWTVTGPINGPLDDGATVEVTCKPSCYLGADDSEVPTYTQGES